MLVTLGGCTPVATDIGTIVPYSSGAEFVIGFLQGISIAFVLLLNLFGFLFLNKHTEISDLYLTGHGEPYAFGFGLGFFVFLLVLTRGRWATRKVVTWRRSRRAIL